jgi:hypothetical protein
VDPVKAGFLQLFQLLDSNVGRQTSGIGLDQFLEHDALFFRHAGGSQAA